MASSHKRAAAATAVALLGRNDGARAQLRQSLEELGASVVFEGEAAGTAAGQLFERAPRVVIVNLADGGDEELDHLQPVFDAPEINVVFNESDVSSRLQGWDLARWARHLAAKVLGESDTMPPAPDGAEALPQSDFMPSPGAPPTPAQLAPLRAIEEFMLEAEDRVDALPEDFLPMPSSASRADEAQEPTQHLDVDSTALHGALRPRELPAAGAEPTLVRQEAAPDPADLPDEMPLPDLGELERALEAQAQITAPARSDRELLDEALGGLDLDFIVPVTPDEPVHDGVDDGVAGEGLALSEFADDVSMHDAQPFDAKLPHAGAQWADPAPPAPPVLPFGALFLEGDLDAHRDHESGVNGSTSHSAEASDPISDTALLSGDADDFAASDAGALLGSALEALDAPFETGDLDFAHAAASSPAGSSIADEWSLQDEASDDADSDNADVFSVSSASAALPSAELDLADAADAFGFTLEDMNAAFETAPAPSASAASDDMLAFDAEDDFIVADNAEHSSAPDSAPVPMSWASGHEDIAFDDNASLDDDVAALAAQLDALEQSPSRFSDSGLDALALEDMLDSEDAIAQPSAAPATPATAAAVQSDAVAPEKDAAPIDFGTLQLTSMDDEIVTAPVFVKNNNFDFSGIENLSLEPLEDEAEAAAKAAADNAGVEIDPLLIAMGLMEAPVAPAPQADAGGGIIERVIVLGASIGGPDALRTFLAGIPAGFPALFLLVQHLENGYFERLAQQLQKATKLTVRALAPDVPAAVAGEVLVVPANMRFTVWRDGSIDAEPHAQPPHYTPCIDEVMRDAADQFGAAVTAIIFSGMAGDAIEGAVYVTGKGGEVWAQDPSSCVVSSMVDGAKARGVVEYIGSPRELAERCVTLYGK